MPTDESVWRRAEVNGPATVDVDCDVGALKLGSAAKMWW